MGAIARKLEHERLRFGCYLTHIKLWRALLESTYHFAIVLEDDTFIVPNFMQELRMVMHVLPQHWDLLYLNATESNVVYAIHKRISQLRGALGTFAYVISKSGAAKLLALPTVRTDKPIDHMIDSAILMGQVNAFLSSRSLVGHLEHVESTLAYV